MAGKTLLYSSHCHKVISFRLPFCPYHRRAAFLWASGLRRPTENPFPLPPGGPLNTCRQLSLKASQPSPLSQPHLTSIGLDLHFLTLPDHPPLIGPLKCKKAHTRAHRWVGADLNPGPRRTRRGSCGAVLAVAMPRMP